VGLWWRGGFLGDVVAAALLVFLIGYFVPSTGILDDSWTINAYHERLIQHHVS
jgi:hypothetical protein